MPVVHLKSVLTFLTAVLMPCAPSSVSAADNATRPPASGPESPGAAASSRVNMVERYGKLPLSFEANQGQVDSRVRFLAHGDGYSLFLTDSEAVLALRTGNRGYGLNSDSDPSAKALPRDVADEVRMHLIGASHSLRVSGVEPLAGTANYFVGNDAAKWRTNVATYAGVTYSGVYPGVDLVYYGKQHQLEYDFRVAPHADPGAVRVRFAGARKLELNSDGSLTVFARHGDIVFHKPVIYQDGDRRHDTVQGGFLLLKDNTIAFKVGPYDRGRTLVIDPVLVYSTYLGGSPSATGNAIAVDASGSTYIAGMAISTNFPTTAGAFQVTNPATTPTSSAAFVTKMSADGTAVVYSTYLSGKALGGTAGTGIAVDGAGNAYVTGSTTSSDFPVTAGAYSSTNPSCTFFVTKLNASGTGLIYSTFLGTAPTSLFLPLGQSFITVDPAGSAYVVATGTGGFYASPLSFPTTAGAFQTTKRGSNAGIAKLNPAGTSIVYSTYLGGSVEDLPGGITLDAQGNLYLTGLTLSTDFPVTAGALQTKKNGIVAAFLTKVNATGTALVYSTFLNGSAMDGASGVAVDAAGNAYVAGAAGSADFPVTLGSYQGGSGGLFIAKFNPAATALVYSAIIGGSFSSLGSPALAIDTAGNAYVVCETLAGLPSLPTTPDAYQPAYGGQGPYLAILNAAGNGLLYATFFGTGSANAIALDAAANIYLTGKTASVPTTPGVFQPTLHPGATSNAFIAKFTSGLFSTVNAASFLTGGPIAPNSIATSFGVHLSSPLADASQGATVTIIDSTGASATASPFYLSPAQVNFLVPSTVATGAAQVQIVAADGVSTQGPIQIASVAPGIFTADGKLAVGTAVHVDAQGNQTSQNLVNFDSATGQFIPVPIFLDAVQSPSASTVLILYGTGIRNAPLSQISVSIGGQTLTPDYAGAQGQFSGEDQVNFVIPKILASAGDVAITLNAPGIMSNTVHVTIQ